MQPVDHPYIQAQCVDAFDLDAKSERILDYLFIDQFLDLAAAFNMADRELLAHHLFSAGICVTALQRLLSFIHDRGRG